MLNLLKNNMYGLVVEVWVKRLWMDFLEVLMYLFRIFGFLIEMKFRLYLFVMVEVRRVLL